MMMMRSRSDGGSSGGSDPAEPPAGWEVRPGGLLVQRRSADPHAPPPPSIRLRISHGDARLDVSVASRATFGDLKKVLAAETGMQPEEQMIVYKGKARENGEYLGVCGVKNRSKLELVRDPTSVERRYIEMRRNARSQSAQKAVSGVSMEVDKLADQVTAIQKSISNGNKVADTQITTLIESLMRQAVKLESISTDGDTSPQKNIQAKRVQKCVEMLDTLKISNSKIKPVISTTNWETFEDQNTTQWEIFD